MSTVVSTKTPASVTGTLGAGSTWTNISNIIDSNETTYAASTTTSQSTTRQLIFSDFNFNIPTSGTITTLSVGVFTLGVQAASAIEDTDTLAVSVYSGSVIVSGSDGYQAIEVERSDAINGPYLHEISNSDWTNPAAFSNITPEFVNSTGFVIRAAITNDGGDTTATEYRIYSLETTLVYTVPDPAGSGSVFHKTSSIARCANGIFKY